MNPVSLFLSIDAENDEIVYTVKDDAWDNLLKLIEYSRSGWDTIVSPIFHLAVEMLEFKNPKGTRLFLSFPPHPPLISSFEAVSTGEQ